MKYIKTGEIVSVHGLNGEVKVYPHADTPDFLEEFDTFYIQKNKMHYQEFVATSVRVHKNIVLIKFEGIDNVELARGFIGKDLFLNKEEIELEEGRFFVEDLIDCTVIEESTNKVIGKIYDVKNLGASDIYYIKNENGKEYMFPAVDEFIINTDVQNKTIFIKVIEGMFDEN